MQNLAQCFVSNLHVGWNDNLGERIVEPKNHVAARPM